MREPVHKPLTPKIRLLILRSSCNTFPCKLVMKIWCAIKAPDEFEYSHYLFAR